VAEGTAQRGSIAADSEAMGWAMGWAGSAWGNLGCGMEDI